MRTLRLILSYDGTDYAGWQRQENALAIQQVLEEAFAQFNGGQPLTVAGAGRTDAGVHALGQVVSIDVAFDTPVDAIRRALNVALPHAIRVLSVEEARPGFHARFDARGKAYRYRISRGAVQSPLDRLYAWHVPWPLDVAAMQTACAALVGRHDFASFQASRTLIDETTRVVTRAELCALNDDELVLNIEGSGFLRHMVRIIAGTLVEIGSGHKPPDMPGIIAARDRAAAGRTAPPHGLVLVAVKYEVVRDI